MSYKEEYDSTFKCFKITCQASTQQCLFKVTFATFAKYQLKVIQQSFSPWLNFLVTLILQWLTSHNLQAWKLIDFERAQFLVVCQA